MPSVYGGSRARAAGTCRHRHLTETAGKSSGDTGVRELRASGVSAEAVIGRATHAAGLIDRVRPIAASEVRLLSGGSKRTRPT